MSTIQPRSGHSAAGYDLLAMKKRQSSRNLVVMSWTLPLLIFVIATFLREATFSPALILLGLTIAAYFGLLFSTLSDQPEEIFELDKVFLVIFGYYTVLPFAAYTIHPEISIGAVMSLDMIEYNLPALVCIALALAGIIIGMRLPFGRKVADRIPSFAPIWNRNEGVQLSVMIICFGLALYLYLIYEIGVEVYLNASYVETYQLAIGKGYLGIGVVFIQIGILLLYTALTDEENPYPWLPLLAMVLFTATTFRLGRRSIVLETVLGLLAIKHFHAGRIRRGWMLVVTFLFMVGMVVIGQARSSMNQGLTGMVEYIQYDFSTDDLWNFFNEGAAVPFSVDEVTKMIPQHMSYQWGKTYIQTFEMLVPRAIYPDRPLSQSEWFAQEVAPDVAAQGGGFSFSHIAEGYVNFGYIGVFMVCFGIGFFINCMVQYRRLHPRSKSVVFLYGIVSTSLIAMNRGDSAMVLKTLMLCTWLPALLAVLWLGRNEFRSNRALIGRPQQDPVRHSG